MLISSVMPDGIGRNARAVATVRACRALKAKHRFRGSVGVLLIAHCANEVRCRASEARDAVATVRACIGNASGKGKVAP